MARYSILGVRRPAAGLVNALGTVTFGYTRTEYDVPLQVTRYVKPREGAPAGEKGKNYPVVTAVDGTKFKFHDVVIQKGDGPGKAFLALNANVPPEVCAAVVRDALAELDKLPESDVNEQGMSPDEIPF